MRTVDRHDQLLRLLRRRADWTVADLARDLGVSRRTVLRDLGALRGAGFDIDTFSGPGGGVRLNPTSVMITSQLGTNEVVALIVSVELARAAKTVPFAAGAQHALAKIEQALPAARAAHLRALCERILVGEPSGEARPGNIDPNLVEAFETAFTSTRLLAFTYHDRHGRRTKRRVEPHGLLVRQPLWYVIAWDSDSNAPRLFRADRVSTPTVSDHTFVARPSELVTGVCPDATPATTGYAGAGRPPGNGKQPPNDPRRKPAHPGGDLDVR
ncbi:MAG TPA: WYL domain-containing protein [Pseudonocardiaceae bacterium]|jgi:predicted DNA-binding transcriptional regulator YafY